jgi:hypothetical protein
LASSTQEPIKLCINPVFELTFNRKSSPHELAKIELGWLAHVMSFCRWSHIQLTLEKGSFNRLTG